VIPATIKKPYVLPPLVAPTKKEFVNLLEVGFEWNGKDNYELTYFRKRK
jgi:hypothetical protein